MACLMGNGCLAFSGTNAWFLDSGASWHMTRMRLVFLSFIEIDTSSYVGCGANTRHVLAVKGVGSVKFQLESRGSLELYGVLFVLELPVNLPSVLAFEVD